MSTRAFMIAAAVIIAVMIVAVYMHLPLIRHSLAVHGGR